MSDLKSILDRLVQENLHGPINPGNQDTVKSHVIRQANRDPNTPYDDTNGSHDDEDMDGRDPRWRQLFHEFFVSDQSDDTNDDLLFYVQRASDEVQNGGLGVDPVFVKRKVKGGQRVLTPEQESVVLWKDTFFLNVIVQLQCKLTVAVCSRVAETNPVIGITKTSMTCTRTHVTKRVYALPTKSRMDVKQESVECSWPLIYYVIDDFEDMFEQLMVHENEYLCVELAVTLPASSGSRSQGPFVEQEASWTQPPSRRQHYNDAVQIGKPFPSTSIRGGSKITLFQGAAGYQNLLGIYQQKAASKVGRRFKLGPHTVPTEFVMMRGPGGRGHAQVAITASSIRDDSSFEDKEEDARSPTSPTSPASPTWPSSPLKEGVSRPDKPVSRRQHGQNEPSEKILPPIPNQNGHGHGHGHRQEVGFGGRHHTPLQPPTPPTKVQVAIPKSSPPPVPSKSSGTSPPPRSFTPGSFFQSLRRISLATLAQATGGSYEGNAVDGEGGPTTIANQNHVHSSNGNNNRSTHSLGSDQGFQASASANRPGSSTSSTRSGFQEGPGSGMISASGVGSRQDIEALVKQPQSLRCCMTFVNVPWTGIVSMLLDHAYSVNAGPESTVPRAGVPQGQSIEHRHHRQGPQG